MKTKENKAMRLASVLLVLTLLATSLTAGTFAKYTTGESGTATAKVAKFGVDVEVNTEKLFGKKYDTSGVVETDDSGIIVETTGGEKVVAPGTTGSMTFKVTGTPETKVGVNISVRNTSQIMLKGQTYKTNAGEKEVTTNYNPVKWTLKTNDQDVEGCTDTTLETINAYFEGDKFKKEFDAGTNLENNINYTLSWKWAYDENKGANDNADTILGDISAKSLFVKKADGSELIEGTDYNLEETFTFGIKVTQAD